MAITFFGGIEKERLQLNEISIWSGRLELEADRPEGEKAVAWIGPWEKSRVVVIQLGHGREAHENPKYRELVRNAILWSAGKP